MTLSKDEEISLQLIPETSDNDPEHPEFPPNSPSFPATPTRQIDVKGFGNVWLKDESLNPTGTHKDRMAWEIIVTYREFLMAKKRGLISSPLPAMSIISSGSAAAAIQTQLKQYNLPNLKVLLDVEIDTNIAESLEEIGCEIFVTDLSQRA